MTDARGYGPLLDALSANGGPVRDWRIVHLPADRPPWTATDLVVAKGDEVTWLATGRVLIMAEMDLWMPPTFALWGRIGGGPIFKGTRDTTSFVADRDGPIALAIYQGEWATPDGTLATPVEAYAGLGEGIDVVLIRWRGTAADGLGALLAKAPGEALAKAEAARLASPVRPPEGWRYLWYLGDGEIFGHRTHEGRPCIAAHTRNDVGILQKPVTAPVDEATSIAWSWNLSRLPTDVAEDQAHTHDYMSIAVEFDTGQDLTYYWSAALPEGTHYRCPLPTWAAKETHWVLRSGATGIGIWHAERRPLLADYREAVGGPDPTRVVAVWLIAVSLFRHGEGEAFFRDIALEGGFGRVPVL
jgi:hypothetical protein